MDKNILVIIEAISNEKDVDKETIYEAIEEALEIVTCRNHREDIDVRVSIDRKTGDYKAYQRWIILDDKEKDFDMELFVPTKQKLISAVKEEDPSIQPGDYIEKEMDSVDFGRVHAQVAKHAIIQKVREAERARIIDIYRDKVDEMLGGVVKRVDRNGVLIDLGGHVEALIKRDDLIPREAIRQNDRVRGYLYKVEANLRGPQLFMSRTAPELLVELFKLEVPEINEGLIEIMGSSRDPGARAKISVRANDARLDPIGACVGMRGSRVQAISNELANERIDIVMWDESAARYITNAMSPADIASIVVDEDTQTADIAVVEENLSQAIGRGGQNIRLASELTGWTLNVMSIEELEEKNEVTASEVRKIFMEQLGVDEEIANILVQEGYSNIIEVAYVPEHDILGVEEFDNKLVKELRARARDVLLTTAIKKELMLGDIKINRELLKMEGMSKGIAYELAERGIETVEDLADQSVDELLDIEGMDEGLAGSLIMTARAPLFK